MTDPNHGQSQQSSQSPRKRRRHLRADPGAAKEPSAEELQSRLLELERQLSDQKKDQDQLKLLNAALEQEVADRTALAKWRAGQLRALIGELTQAEQRERRRLAELLHDHLQQQLVAAKFKVAKLQRILRNADALEVLLDIRDVLDESIDASRVLTYELNPPVLHESGFLAALEWLAQWKEEKHGLKVEIRGEPGVEPGDESIKVLLFQTIRELLFNVVKHAKTNRARVELERSGKDQIQVAVCDEGAGFDPASLTPTKQAGHGFGLSSVRERIQWMGGQLDIQSSPGRGTRAVIVVPASLQSPAPQN